MSFCDHLGAYEDVCLSVGKFLQYVYISVFSADGVGVHPYYLRLRKVFFYAFLYFLCTRAKISYFCRTASRTLIRFVYDVSAVVAYQSVAGGMVFVRHVAVRALKHISAVSARYECRMSPPVYKKHCLSAVFKIFPYAGEQFPAKHAPVAAFKFPSHIHGLYFRLMASLTGSVFKRSVSYISVICPVYAFHRRRRGSHNQGRSTYLAQLFGCLNSVICRSCFGNIAFFVFFIYDYNSQSVKRRKKRRSWADHYGDLSVSGSFPAVEPLPSVHFAVGHSRQIAEPFNKSSCHQRCKRYFRNKNYRLPAFGYDLFYNLYVYLRFSASRNAMYQKRPVFVFSFIFPDGNDCFLLIVQRHGLAFVLYASSIGSGKLLPVVDFHAAFLFQLIYGVVRSLYRVFKLRQSYLAVFLEKIDDLRSLMLSFISVVNAYIIDKIFRRANISHAYIVVVSVLYAAGHNSLKTG